MDYRINELGRFRVLLGGLSASLCISVLYGFNLLSNYLQKEYDLNASDLTTITTTGIVVGFVTFPGGMLLDYVGPMWVLIIATTSCALGAFLFGLAFQGLIAASVLRFSVFCAFLDFGCLWFDTGSLMAVLGSFPRTRGPVVALMKTYAGIGASVLAVINYSFFRESYAAYMYFVAIAIVVLGGIAIVLVRFPPYHLVDREKKTLPLEIQERRRLIEPYYLRQLPPMRRFVIGCLIVVALIVYLTTQSLCGAYVDGISDNTRMGITIGAIALVLLLAVVAAPLPFLGGMSQPPNEFLPPLPGNSMEMGERVLASQGGDWAEEEEVVESDLDPQYQGTFWEDLRTPDLWMLFWTTMVTWSCGFVLTFNSAQIYRALNDNVYDAATNTMYSAIVGVGNGASRLALGVLEVMILRRAPERRPTITCLFPIASCSLFLSVLLLLVLPLCSKAIILGFFFGGFGNGAAWASTALVVRSIYAKDIGKHYNFMSFGTLVGIIAFNRFAYGEQYTRAARQGHSYPQCGGKACVQSGFIILLCACATAIVTSTLVHIRYTRFVKKARTALEAGKNEPNASNTEDCAEGACAPADE
ncbi:uncharacterized protein Tco025E_09405 [Trypanosoma conorhini]|uniref:Nodulin-like domain-containing protein n=1 Tax=Trypanosoma conorhini TaxID=83891 RepID=A0A3R7KC57_9TRYP|nr:uncharacterized protein Tco025E_09405 [Trypanosoma conorhini]RNE97613.1 hypothetical protein Tco025E_09405 [Trypanosoma conorhini]